MSAWYDVTSGCVYQLKYASITKLEYEVDGSNVNYVINMTRRRIFLTLTSAQSTTFLSEFNTALTGFKSYEYTYGSVTYIVALEKLAFLCKNDNEIKLHWETGTTTGLIFDTTAEADTKWTEIQAIMFP